MLSVCLGISEDYSYLFFYHYYGLCLLVVGGILYGNEVQDASWVLLAAEWQQSRGGWETQYLSILKRIDRTEAH